MRLIDGDALAGIIEIAARNLIDTGYSPHGDALMEAAAHVKKFPTIEAEPVRRWISVKDRLPESQTPVLVVIRSNSFPKYIAISVAAHINAHEVTTEDWREYEGDTEYDEENDCFWIHESWYELNSIDDNPNWEINCGNYVTHWMPLPEPPKEEKENGDPCGGRGNE